MSVNPNCNLSIKSFCGKECLLPPPMCRENALLVCNFMKMTREQQVEAKKEHSLLTTLQKCEIRERVFSNLCDCCMKRKVRNDKGKKRGRCKQPGECAEPSKKPSRKNLDHAKNWIQQGSSTANDVEHEARIKANQAMTHASVEPEVNKDGIQIFPQDVPRRRCLHWQMAAPLA